MRMFLYPPTKFDSTGLATSANQVSEIAQLTAINANTDGIEGTLTAIGGYVDQIEAGQTTAQASLDSIDADAAELNLKSAAALVHEPHDYKAITYVGATTNISTVVHKLGGASGTVVATLTMGYDGSNRLTSVTKT